MRNLNNLVFLFLGVGSCSSPFNDNFASQSRDSPAAAITPGSLKQQLANDATWNEEVQPSSTTAGVAAALNGGRRSVSQRSCPGDFAMATDIFDASKDILSGASFKVLAKVVPNSGQLPPDGHHQQLSLPNSEDGFEIPKSNSVNIFAIKDDPFDDDFFQH